MAHVPSCTPERHSPDTPPSPMWNPGSRRPALPPLLAFRSACSSSTVWLLCPRCVSPSLCVSLLQCHVQPLVLYSVYFYMTRNSPRLFVGFLLVKLPSRCRCSVSRLPALGRCRLCGAGGWPGPGGLGPPSGESRHSPRFSWRAGLVCVRLGKGKPQEGAAVASFLGREDPARGSSEGLRLCLLPLIRC